MSRVDQYSVTVVIDGSPTGIWDQMSGGEVDSAEARFRPGGMAPARSLGGSRTVGNITVTRLYDLERDHDLMRALMANRVGKADVIVNRQPLDQDGNPWGEPIVYTGKLKTVTPADVDSDAEDAELWSITVTPEGSIG